MKICKISIWLFVHLLVANGICIANDVPITANSKNDSATISAYTFTKRVLKDKARQFIFEPMDKDGSGDVFEISGRKDKILVKGNNGVSMASGLNGYLKNCCHAQFIVIVEQLNLHRHFKNIGR
jgi:hypothetical protein